MSSNVNIFDQQYKGILFESIYICVVRARIILLSQLSVTTTSPIKNFR